MKILFLSRWFPFPLDNGSRIRIYYLLNQLAQNHHVDLISFYSDPVQAQHQQALQAFCRSVTPVLYQPFGVSSGKPTNRLKAVLGVFSPYPRSVIETENAAMHAAVAEATRQRRYDLVIAAERDMIPYSLRVRAPRLLEGIELEGLHEQTLATENEANVFLHTLRSLRQQLMWRKWVYYLRKIAPAFQAATVVSENERLLVSRTLGNVKLPLAVIPNGVEVARYQQGANIPHPFGAPAPDTLIYSGSLTYHANLDAVLFFVEEILPQIQNVRPAVQLSITGKTESVPLDRLNNRRGVRFTGYLQDIRTTLAQSWINVVPLRLGGGTRLKILESLAIGTPVIATSKGCRGLDLQPGRDILIADSPSDFAAAALRLLNDNHLRQFLASNGQRTVAERYDWQAIGNSLNELIDRIR